MEMTGRADLGLDQEVNFAFIHVTSNRLDVAGQGENKPIREPGIWRVECRLSERNGLQTVGCICLRWEGESAQPVGLADCPAPSSEL